jgi:TolB protein
VFTRWTSPPGSHDRLCTLQVGQIHVKCFTAPGLFQNARWSPDGSRLVFMDTVQENTDIYVANADGSQMQRLTTDLMPDLYPSWSPDGRFIVFTTAKDCSKDWCIAIMKADGSAESVLSSGGDGYPSWGPG